MKLFFLISTLILTLTSCSKNEKNHLKVSDTTLPEIVFEPLSIRTSLVDGINALPSASLDFAILQPKQSGIQELIITNGDSSSLVFGSGDIDASDIAPFIMNENCSNKNIERNRSCKLTFSLMNNPSQTETVLTKSFTIKGTTIQLTATLAADTTPVNSPIVSLIVSPMHLDFGVMKSGEQKELSIAVTNKGLSTQVISAPIISNPKISITSNTCAALSRNRSCSIKIRYSASMDESISQQSFSSIANNDINHSVLVQSPTESNPQVLTINPLLSSSNLNLNEPQIRNASLSFTNTGTLELPSPVQAIAQPATGVTINSVSCSGGLSRGRNCSVSYSLNSALLSGGSSSVQLRLQSGTIASNIHTINLNVTKLAVPCTLSDVQSNGWNTANQASISGMKTGSDVSQCVVQSCNQYFSLNSSTQSCQADACTIANANTFGVGLSNVSTVSGNTPNCVVSSCSNPSLYEVSPDQKSCVDKPLNCTLADSQSNGWNITNAQSPTGIKVGSNISQCSVSSCNTNFTLNSTTKSCDAIACTLANASGNGVTSILNIATVSGTLPNCSVTSCNANYKPATDSKNCVAKLCNELNASELLALGFNTTNATISGTYPSCSLSCNSSLQQLAGDSKSCVDKIPTGSIAFAQSYTKNTTGNQLNITQNNAQQIQFYSDASCATAAGAPLSMPLSQTSINISSGDGTKTVYAKLINGAASSSCLSASIVLDTIVPNSFTISLPVNTTSSANAAPTVNFSSNLSTLDSGSGVYSVEYGIGTSTVNANVVSFFMIPNNSSTFTATAANGYLPPDTIFLTSTNYYTIIRVRDNAQNERVVASAAWTYAPVVTYTGDIFAFSSTYNMVTNTTSLIGITASSFGPDNYTLSPLKFLNTTYTSSGTTFNRILHVQWNGASGGRCGLGMLSVNGLNNISMPMADTANASIKIYTKAECKDRAAILFRVNASLLREIKPIGSQEVYYFSIAP